jgi:hypothetical protein
MWLPASARFKMASVVALWPDDTARAPGMPRAVSGAPSRLATRASKTAWVGFMIRV